MALNNSATLILDVSMVANTYDKTKEWEMRQGPPAFLNLSYSIPTTKSSLFLCIHSSPSLHYDKFHNKKEMMPGYIGTKHYAEQLPGFSHLMCTQTIEVSTVVLLILRITSLVFSKCNKLHWE